jgi:hypothetical protein
MSLGSIRRRFAELKKVPSQIGNDFAEFINEALQEGHDTGTDPHGEPWAELAPATLAKGRTPPPLDETGALRGSANARPTQGAGVVVEYTDEKAQPTQQGSAYQNRPPRMILPNGRMPDSWRAKLKELTTKAVKRK